MSLSLGFLASCTLHHLLKKVLVFKTLSKRIHSPMRFRPHMDLHLIALNNKNRIHTVFPLGLLLLQSSFISIFLIYITVTIF